MRLKHVLLTSTAAVVLAMSGFAQAQQGTPSTDADKPAAQSPGAPPAAPSSSKPSPGAPSSGMPSASAPSAGAVNIGALHAIDGDKAGHVQHLNMSAKDLSDAEIHGADGKKVGEVNKLLADSSNQVKAVTIDVGGFLGIGGREVAIPIDKLQKGEGKKLQTSMTKAEIEQLAEWKDADDDRARRDATPGRAPGSTPPATTR